MDAGRNAIRLSLFADGGGRNELCELQSAAKGAAANSRHRIAMAKYLLAMAKLRLRLARGCGNFAYICISYRRVRRFSANLNKP